jgi:predicted flap endonuclease-1-like 5' DNA nuclease
MLFTSSAQLIVLLLLFLAGLLLGMGLRSGGKKWRKRFNDESGNYAQFRRDADTKLREANRRVTELERENAELRDTRSAETATPVVTAPGATPVAAAATVSAFSPEPLPEPAAEGPKKGWFIAGHRDLGAIRGIDAVLKTRLAALSVTRFEDITGLSAEDEMALEQRLALPAGYIAREQWREQATLLQDGKDAEHAERFPAR